MDGKVVIFLLAYILGPFACAFSDQSFFADFINNGPKQGNTKTSFEYMEFPARAIHEYNGLLRQKKLELLGSTLLKKNETSEIKIRAELGTEEIVTNANIPITREKIPAVFWSPSISSSYSHKSQNNQRQLISFSVSSPSDVPYSRLRLLALSSNLIWQIPKDKNSWLFFLNWSNNRSFLNNIPLPGVAYLWVASEKFQSGFGIPFAFFNYRPTDSWLINGNVFYPSQYQIRIAYFLFGPAQVYALAKTEHRNYLLFNQTRVKDRFFVEDRIASVGFLLPINKVTALDLNGGYAYGRDLFLGEKYSSRKDGRRLNYAGSGFAMLKISANLD